MTQSELIGKYWSIQRYYSYCSNVGSIDFRDNVEQASYYLHFSFVLARAGWIAEWSHKPLWVRFPAVAKWIEQSKTFLILV